MGGEVYKVIHMGPLWHGVIPPYGGPLPPYPPLHTDRMSYMGDNPMNNEK